ncbi:MAG TPA: hypothetical protein VF668_01165 [Pyrinomonadaceae bacterium]|jgi:hypothetical protein
MTTENEITCLYPGCGKVAAEVVNGCLEWRCRHSGATHINLISVEELARKLAKCGYVLLSVTELVALLSGRVNLADVVERFAASP